MTTSADISARTWESPFPAEGFTVTEAGHLGETGTADGPAPAGFTPWMETVTPFVEASDWESEGDAYLASVEEALAELRDEAFAESLADLAAETADALSSRFTGLVESEQERLGEAHLEPLRFEAERYVDSLSAGLAESDVASLSPTQLEEVLARFEPAAGETPLTPAAEHLLGRLVQKARKAVTFVATAAKKAGGAVKGVVGRALAAVLQRLRRLVEPIVRRVLGFAIDRLPAPLRPAAKGLAARLGLKVQAEADGADEDEHGDPLASAALASDPLLLAESFDLALAEVLAGGDAVGAELESVGEWTDTEQDAASGELEALAAARSALVTQLRDAEDAETVAPAIEQFVPALLGALRVGINLVGRPKVVSFLSGYLAKTISAWVGPSLSRPLASAVVDTGLRLMSLEAPGAPGVDRTRAGLEAEAVPALLAATIEDTVRGFAENEDYVFEDEDLAGLALAEAFETAVATSFPPSLVQPELQLAPTLGGFFLPRRPRTAHTYRRFSRAVDVTLTPQMAAAVRTYNGVSLAAALRAVGTTLPHRFRVHVFQAAPGSTLWRVGQVERGIPGLGQGGWRGLHPLTPTAAAVLLREPRLGRAVPARYRRSPHRIAAGQRFYFLQPLAPSASPLGGEAAGATGRGATQVWTRIEPTRSRAVVALYFSETDAQQIAATLNRGNGRPALLRALHRAYREAAPTISPAPQTEELRRALRRGVMRLLATWARARALEFARAAAAPASGVTVTVTLVGLPSGRPRDIRSGGAAWEGATTDTAGQPQGTVVVHPGVRRP